MLKYASDMFLDIIIKDKQKYIDNDIFSRYHKDALTMLKSGYVEDCGPKISASVLMLYYNNGCHNTGNKGLKNPEDIWVFTNGVMHFIPYLNNRAEDEGRTYQDVRLETWHAYLDYLNDYFYLTTSEKTLEVIKKR